MEGEAPVPKFQVKEVESDIPEELSVNVTVDPLQIFVLLAKNSAVNCPNPFIEISSTRIDRSKRFLASPDSQIILIRG